MSGTIGLNLEGCCCPGGGCGTSVAFYNELAALPTSTWTYAISGTFKLKNISTLRSLGISVYAPYDPDCGGCGNINCRILCEGNCLTSNESKWYVYAPVIAGDGNERRTGKQIIGTWCDDCEPPLTAESWCEGLSSANVNHTGAITTGFGPIVTGEGVCGVGTFFDSTLLYRGRKDYVSGTTTTTVASILVLKKTTLPTACTPNCVVLDYRHSVEVSKPTVIIGTAACPGPDYAIQRAQYLSVWNGTDTVAAFIAKQAHCRFYSWNYIPCYGTSTLAGCCETYVSHDTDACGRITNIITTENCDYPNSGQGTNCCPYYITSLDDGAPWANMPLVVTPA